MNDERHELVRIDATGTAHPLGKTASQQMRARQGAFRMMPGPAHVVLMRHVGDAESGSVDADAGPLFRLAGEITAPGALCDIVGLIGQAAYKGELLVFTDGGRRSIFFERGHVISAHSTVEGERLGHVLYRYGALTEAQIATTAKAATPEVRFGEAAVKLGFITRERLYALMGKQTEEIAYAMLLIGDGVFYFLDGYDEHRLPARQNLAVNGLLMEGVRRMDETRYFRDRIPSDAHVPARVSGRDPPAGEFSRVWDAVDDTRSVAELCRVVGQGEFEVTQALFQLAQSGHVVIQAPSPTGSAAIIELFNQAMGVIFIEVDATGRGGEVREQLASFATGAGIYDTLFRKAGPDFDGTFEPAPVIENAVALVGAEHAEEMLAQWLYEYVSFALFVAEPYLRPGQGDKRAAGWQLATRVAELVAPLAPKR